MAGASLEIMAASRPCLQTLQSQNCGKKMFLFRKKGKNMPNCSQRGSHWLLLRVFNPLAPRSKWGGELVYQRRCGENFLRPWSKLHKKMIMELLTDSLHFRATPYEGCLRGQMLQLLPRWNIFCVCLCRNSQLDAHGQTWNIRNVKTSADSLLNTITKNLSFCAALLSLLKAFLLTISGMILSSAPSISALMTTLKCVVEHWQTGAHFDITVM